MVTLLCYNDPSWSTIYGNTSGIMEKFPITRSAEKDKALLPRFHQKSYLNRDTLSMILLAVFFLVHPLSRLTAQAAEIQDVKAVKDGSLIMVSTELKLDDSQIEELGSGMQKELIMYIDLFRSWNLWPNEFIYGITISQIMKSDPVKKEFILVTRNGTGNRETRFNSLDSLLGKALKFENIRAFTSDGLPQGKYFVKVTFELRIRKLAPIISYLLFFVPEKEFSIWKNSEIVGVGEP